MLFNLELAFGGVCGGLSLINRVLRSKAGRFLSMDFRKWKFFPLDSRSSLNLLARGGGYL